MMEVQTLYVSFFLCGGLNMMILKEEKVMRSIINQTIGRIMKGL
jgi:hypothetical protein